MRNLLQYETFSPIAFSADVDLERIVSGPIAECSVLQDVLPGIAFCSLREGMTTRCVAVQSAECMHGGGLTEQKGWKKERELRAGLGKILSTSI